MKRPSGESSSSVMLLSRECGLIRASAKSARAERSKLRYGLETFTHARFSLVRGRYEWKITGVTGSSRFTFAETAAMRAAGRISKLLLRLLQGEAPVPRAFEVALEGFNALMGATSADEIDATEIVTVLRLLAHLGYLPHSDALEPFVGDGFSLELSARALASRGLLIKTINESLQATGL